MTTTELKTELKTLRKTREHLKYQKDYVLRVYHDMRGMYACDYEDLGMGQTVYYYNPGMEEKEYAEREAFLEKTGYNEIDNRLKDVEKQIEALEDEQCLLKYGETKRVHELKTMIQSLGDENEELLAKVQKNLEEIENLKKKLTE